MTINDKIRDEKLQYDIDREGAKISALLSGKIDKYEYLAGEEIILPGQIKGIEQAEFACSLLGKAFERQTETIEKQEKKTSSSFRSFKTRRKYGRNKISRMTFCQRNEK